MRRPFTTRSPARGGRGRGWLRGKSDSRHAAPRRRLLSHGRLRVIAAGKENLGQAAYRVSLAERIARFRQEVDLTHRLLEGPPVEAFE